MWWEFTRIGGLGKEREVAAGKRWRWKVSDETLEADDLELVEGRQEREEIGGGRF